MALLVMPVIGAQVQGLVVGVQVWGLADVVGVRCLVNDDHGAQVEGLVVGAQVWGLANVARVHGLVDVAQVCVLGGDVQVCSLIQLEARLILGWLGACLDLAWLVPGVFEE